MGVFKGLIGSIGGRFLGGVDGAQASSNAVFSR